MPSNGAITPIEADRELFDVFTCIKNHCTIYDAGKLLSENSERYLKTRTQMLTLFEDYPDAVDRTREIADRINFSLDELRLHLSGLSRAAGRDDGFGFAGKGRESAV